MESFYDEIEVETCGWSIVHYLCKLNSVNDVLFESNENEENDQESQISIELDINYLKSLDPKEWKEQDHYHVLGLKNLRYKATMADIKTAYRQAVLCHHPDKRKAKGETVDQDSDYFTCITMAWEVLGDVTKRRAYDSVDPTVDDSIPSNTSYSDEQFYEIFGKAFRENGRWSENQPVPQLGNDTTPRAQVEKFYSFWYDFQSWREYSYEDEESKEKGQDRDERRWIEKQNRVVRAKKKREEMSRIRSLVDLSYENDPRIKRFKQEDKDKKDQIKKAKAVAAQQRQEQIDRLKREEEEEKRKLKEQEEAEERAKQLALKAERESFKKNLRKERKTLRDLCKSNNYFSDEVSNEASNMRAVELLCESLSLDEIKVFNNALKDGGKQVFIHKVTEVEKKLEQERLNSLNASKTNRSSHSSGTNIIDKWSDEQTALLIKAVNLFPAGTNQRWEVVANFINQHSKGQNIITVTAKDVLIKAKEMQSSADQNVRHAANKKAFENFEKQKKSFVKVDEIETSRRFDEGPWTCDEQKLLEQALKTYPASHSDRWDNIAATIPTRTKKECMKRYKELVEMVKAKKQAVQSLNN